MVRAGNTDARQSNAAPHTRRPSAALGGEGELLERMAVSRGTATAHRERPGDLADVDSVLRVHGDTMRRGKTPGGRGLGRPPSGHNVAVRIKDTDAGVAGLRNGAKAL